MSDLIDIIKDDSLVNDVNDNIKKLGEMIDDIFPEKKGKNKLSLAYYLSQIDSINDKPNFWKVIKEKMEQNILLLRKSDMLNLLKNKFNSFEYLEVVKLFMELQPNAFGYSEMKYLSGLTVIIDDNHSLNFKILQIIFPNEIDSNILQEIAENADEWFGILLKEDVKNEFSLYETEKIDSFYLFIKLLCEKYQSIKIMSDEYLEKANTDGLNWENLKDRNELFETTWVDQPINFTATNKKKYNELMKLLVKENNIYYLPKTYRSFMLDEIKNNPLVNFKIIERSENVESSEISVLNGLDISLRNKIEYDSLICKEAKCEAIIKNKYGITCFCNKQPKFMIKDSLQFYCCMDHSPEKSNIKYLITKQG